VAPFVSLVTMVGFFAILIILVSIIHDVDKISNNQLINICIGALVAAFSTVVNFWLGSSKGSQDKDATNFQLQAAHAAQTSEVIKTQAAQTADALKTAAKAATPGAPAGGGAGTDAADNFTACVTNVLLHEGGYTNDPHDRGKATNYGITIADLKEWRNDPNLTDDDVKNMKKDEAIEIYRTKYWNPMRCGEMPKGVDLAVFDFGVNSGNSRSIKFLQRKLGVTNDGSIGPITMSAINATNARALVQGLCADRLAFLQGLSDWQYFGNGWGRRVQEVEQTALQMLG
jgi:hypothetical protein